MENNMNEQKAIEIIKQVCDKFVGTKQDHILIEQAIMFIENELITSLEK